MGGLGLSRGLDRDDADLRPAQRSLRPAADPVDRHRAVPRRFGALRAVADHAATDRRAHSARHRRRRIALGVAGGDRRRIRRASAAATRAIFRASWRVSNLLGPVLGGFFADYLSWHWIFWINMPIGVLALVLCNRNLRRLPRPRESPQSIGSERP